MTTIRRFMVCPNCGNDTSSFVCSECHYRLPDSVRCACGFVGPRSAYADGRCPQCNVHYWFLQDIVIGTGSTPAPPMTMEEQRALHRQIWADRRARLDREAAEKAERKATARAERQAAKEKKRAIRAAAHAHR